MKGDLIIPNSVTSIDHDAFAYCSGLTSITIPNSVTSIGGSAFYGCSGLTSVTIPNSVTSIGQYAFQACSGLTSVTIPNSVTSIGQEAFSGCSSLTSVTLNNNSLVSKNRSSSSSISNIFGAQVKEYILGEEVTSIGERAFYECSGLTSVTIPNSVTSIGERAFYECSGLTSVTIPNSVTSIGQYAFYNCSGLTSVTIPNSVTSIGYNAFDGCSRLTAVHITDLAAWCGISFSSNPLYYAHHLYLNGEEVKGDLIIPNSVTSIGYAAFYGCSGLTSINIPNSVTSIGYSAFSGCSGLTSITIPNSVTSIGSSAFRGCSRLTSVSIPNSVTSIGNGAFRGCSGLTSITIPNSVTSIGERAFYECSGLTSVTIPNSVTSIGERAFYECSGLTSVTIPNSVTSIGGSAFYGCSGLTAVRIGNNVTEIPGGVFSNCTNLTSVVIGDGVYKINGVAFSGCKNLESIISVSPTPPIISTNDNPFETITYKHAILKVPLGCKSRYWSADYWKDFAYIEEMDMTAYREGVEMEEGDKASRYATFYDSQSAYTLPAGLKASVVTGMSSGKLVYKVIAEGGKSNNVVPKGVAVMLTSAQEDASAYTLTPTESDVTYTGTNWLYGSDEATTTTASGNCRFYKLSYGASDTDKSEVFGWYWGAANGGAFSIAGHKAWLAVPTAAGAPTRSFSMEGDATDIVDIETTKMQNEDEGYYDLQGRRVTEPVSRGIYIHKGKKIIIR